MGTPLPPNQKPTHTATEWKQWVDEAKAEWDKHFAEADETMQILMLRTSSVPLVRGKTLFEATRDHFIRTYGPKFAGRVLNDPRYFVFLGLDKPGAHTVFVEPGGTD